MAIETGSKSESNRAISYKEDLKDPRMSHGTHPGMPWDLRKILERFPLGRRRLHGKR